MIWHRLGTQICMRLAHASTHLGAYQGAFAIASYSGERVSHERVCRFAKYLALGRWTLLQIA
jgi:hypothetical protein